jgi:translation initiation factor IF-3
MYLIIVLLILLSFTQVGTRLSQSISKINLTINIMIKEIKCRPQLSEEDYNFKLGHAIRFLKNNDELKMVVTFRGRELTHPERGEALLLKYAADMEAYATAKLPPVMDDRQMILVFTPKVGDNL